jgi:peptide/nickel transport system substrate-binding protein
VRIAGGIAGSCAARPWRWAAAPLFVLGLASATVAAEIPRDTVVMAKSLGDVTSLDPAEAYEISAMELLGNLYDRLLDHDPAHMERLEGALARSWSVAADGRTYTFKLRAGQRFASGNRVTARDAAFSLQRAVLLARAPSFILAQFGFTAANVRDRIRALDDETLELETASVVAPSFLYYCLTAIVGSVVDEQVVRTHARDDDLGSAWLAGHAAGSGPYQLRAWRPGERYSLDASSAHWRGAPRNRRVLVVDIREAATQRLLLERGDVDYARDLEKDQLAALAANPRIAFDRAPEATLVYLALNQRAPALRDPAVIEALKYLVDYDGIARHVLGSGYVVHQSLLPHGLLGAIDDAPYRFDPARARALLAAAGLGEGFPLSVDVRSATPWIDVAAALQAGFAEAGVRLAIVPSDGKQNLTKYRAGRHELFLGEWASDYPDPHSNAQAFAMNDEADGGTATKTLASRNGWRDDRIAALARRAAAEPDGERRAELYADLQREHQRRAPFIFMFQRVAVAAHRAGVEGFVMGLTPDRTRYAGIAKP